MCIEFSLKRAGIPIVRNFLHCAEGVMGGLPIEAQKRMKIHFKVKIFDHGKVQDIKYVESILDAFPCKGDTQK